MMEAEFYSMLAQAVYLDSEVVREIHSTDHRVIACVIACKFECETS